MEKIFLLLIFTLYFTALNSDAIIITANDIKLSQAQVKNYNNMPYGNYLKYYIIDNGRLNLTFKNLSPESDKEFEKGLTKEQKQDYKYTKKIQELIDKGAWGQALYKYPNFYPLLVQYYNNCIEKKLYEEALRTLDKIRFTDKYYQIYSKDIINNELALVYMKTKQYDKALEIYKLFIPTNQNQDYIFASIAECYYYLGKYDESIQNINLIKDKKYKDYELLYSVYLDKNDLGNAHQIAIKMCNLKYNYENIMRLYKTSRTENDRLKYAYQARNTTLNEADITLVNQIIADIEQKRIQTKISNIKQFIKVPQWKDILNQLPPDISASELSKKQDEFFSASNKYLKQYEGQQLANAFYTLNQDFLNYALTKKTEYYQQQQLALQKALEESIERENYIRQQQMYQQQMIERQRQFNRIYYLQHRSYYSNPLMYDPFW